MDPDEKIRTAAQALVEALNEAGGRYTVSVEQTPQSVPSARDYQVIVREDRQII